MSNALALPHAPATLPPLARHALIVAVVAAHGVAAWGLLQKQPAPAQSAAHEAAPLFVSLIAQPVPKPPVQPPQQPKVEPPRKVMAHAPPAETPAPFVVSEPPPAPEPVKAVEAAPESIPAAPATAPAPPPQPAAPPAPLTLPATAVQYLDPPRPVYPQASRRAYEAGEVQLRVEIGTDGRAREISVLRSSGFARLDESAQAAVRAARFTPYSENGVARVVWTVVPISFELQR